MLTALTIRNLALIDTLDIEPQAGFTVLTGETGAGKSMVLDALQLALGGRAEAGMIRAGEQACDITATFQPPANPVITTVLEGQGLEPTETLTLRRQLKTDGGKVQSRAWLNGTPVPVNVLAALADHLVDIHSQHGTLALMTPAAQKAVLDAFHGNTQALQAVQTTHQAWHSAQTALEAVRIAADKALADADLRAAWLKELTQLGYDPGEEETLAAKRARLQNATQLHQYLQTSEAALSDDGGAVSSAVTAVKYLSLAKGLDESLEPLSNRLADTLEALRDIAYDLSRAANPPDMDMTLEEVDDRLHALRDAARKHRVQVAELADVLARLHAEEATAQTSTEHLAELEKLAKNTRQAFASACQTLTKARTEALPSLHTQLHEALASLLMPKAREEVQLTPLPPESWNGEGAETVTFLLAANPGQPAQPIAKVASGGELSRLMLALKTVFYKGLPPQTIVLDEIDSGLSGAAAHAVGAAMKSLAQTHQLLAITHHAQVAAQARNHWQVAKNTEKSHTTTTVQVLTEDTRTTELARLLSGATITETARAAARELLAA